MGRLNLEVDHAKRRVVVAWLNSLFPELNLPSEESELELRMQLFDGSVFNGILRRLNLGAVDETPNGGFIYPERRLENVEKFLSVVHRLGLPTFDLNDLDKGNLSAVVECLFSIRSYLGSAVRKDRIGISLPRSRSLQISRWRDNEDMNDSLADGTRSSPVFGDNKQLNFAEVRFQRTSRSLVYPDSTSATSCHSGHKFHEFFHLKPGQYCELPASKISEMIKSDSLNNAPTQLLLRVANGILDESIERKNEELPQRVACLLKIVVQEIERRITTQAEHIRHQNNLMKVREEKYLSRIAALETLHKGTREEIKPGESKIGQQKRLGEEDLVKLMMEKENNKGIISELKQILRTSSKSIKQEVVEMQKKWKEDIERFEVKLRVVTDAADSYRSVMLENRKLYNDVQELKGNIRVFCRIRPLPPGENKKAATEICIGESGELVIVNPFNQGKDGQKVFKFNKVYSATATQVSDVLELLQIGQVNRAMCATAFKSKKQPVITIHVQGIDLITGDTLHGSLHLVDLAGSERVGPSEVAGDRLKEAQYINKSLSALGDVIFALSQKNAHVPYRNSKLTQVLQSSLGGHGKQVMFVQISPDAKSYSETISTLKFAKRVSEWS
ncbi:hypothetical protein HPP92_008706 [Vanilla planifolia]|uniref:Kinesin-like protein n=1 Tax=Vanilla planifolia TaxID=51239 RepID=A0A835V411_VANPL|nr:hypothetical protein HPP92_008706 [Vanilla planifolia]